MDAASGVIIGAIITGTIVFLNDVLRRGWEKEKWIIDKREGAYLECLKLLGPSRRSPLRHDDGQEYLEEVNYQGLMSAMLLVPAWMTMMQCYSSKESVKDLEPVCDNITRIVTELKSKEHEITAIGEKKYVNELGISRAIENALPVIKKCFERELLDIRSCRLCTWLRKVCDYGRPC